MRVVHHPPASNAVARNEYIYSSACPVYLLWRVTGRLYCNLYLHVVVRVNFVYSNLFAQYFNIASKVSFLKASATCLTNCICVKVLVVLTVA